MFWFILFKQLTHLIKIFAAMWLFITFDGNICCFLIKNQFSPPIWSSALTYKSTVGRLDAASFSQYLLVWVSDTFNGKTFELLYN